MIVAVCSLGGAPGATTIAGALASCWPATPMCVPVLVEADASGGDMAAWHRRSTAQGRGLASLAAATRRPQPAERRENQLLDHATELVEGLQVVTAPSAAHQVTGAVQQLAHNPWPLQGARVAILDVGRISPGAPSTRLLAAADAVVVAVREDVAQLTRLAECADVVSRLEENGVRVGAVVTPARSGRAQFSDREIGQQTGLPVWARVPHDQLGASHLRGEPLPVARSIVARLQQWKRERQDASAAEWMPLMQSAACLAERLDSLTPRTASGAIGRPAMPAPQPCAAPEQRPAAVPAALPEEVAA